MVQGKEKIIIPNTIAEKKLNTIANRKLNTVADNVIGIDKKKNSIANK